MTVLLYTSQGYKGVHGNVILMDCDTSMYTSFLKNFIKMKCAIPIMVSSLNFDIKYHDSKSPRLSLD